MKLPANIKTSQSNEDAGKKIMFLYVGEGCMFRPFLDFQQLAHRPCRSQWVPQFQEGSKKV